MIFNLNYTAKIISTSDGDNGATLLGLTKIMRAGCDKLAEKAFFVIAEKCLSMSLILQKTV